MRTYEYRLRPTKAQEQALMKTLMASPKMYNTCLDNGRFKAPGQCGGRIRVIVHRPLEGTFKFARIVLRPSGWYLQCVCETEPQLLPKKENAVGLDMGIRYLVADSNGYTIDNPKHSM